MLNQRGSSTTDDTVNRRHDGCFNNRWIRELFNYNIYPYHWQTLLNSIKCADVTSSVECAISSEINMNIVTINSWWQNQKYYQRIRKIRLIFHRNEIDSVSFLYKDIPKLTIAFAFESMDRLYTSTFNSRLPIL